MMEAMVQQHSGIVLSFEASCFTLPTLSAIPNALGSWTPQKKGTLTPPRTDFQRRDRRDGIFFSQKNLLVQSIATEQWNDFELSFLSLLLNP